MAAQSVVAIYTGNGKGKTTAAVGQIIRACGAGWRVGLIRLLKDESSSELSILSHLPQLEILTVNPQLKGFYSELDEAGREEIDEQCRGALKIAVEWLVGQQVDLLVIDEAMVALKWGIITSADLLELCQTARSRRIHLVLTGRYAAEELIAYADLVTEMQEIKHPYQQGCPAQKGLDF